MSCLSILSPSIFSLHFHCMLLYEELRRYFEGKIYLDDKSEVYTEWFLRWGKTSNFRRSMVDQYWEQLLEGRGRWKRYSSNYFFRLYETRNMKGGNEKRDFWSFLFQNKRKIEEFVASSLLKDSLTSYFLFKEYLNFLVKNFAENFDFTEAMIT